MLGGPYVIIIDIQKNDATEIRPVAFSLKCGILQLFFRVGPLESIQMVTLQKMRDSHHSFPDGLYH